MSLALPNKDGNYVESLRLSESLSNVNMQGISGLSLARAQRLILFKDYFDVDIVFIQIGGNDFKKNSSSCSSPSDTAAEMMKLADSIKNQFPRVKKIVFGALLPRFNSIKFHLTAEDAAIYRKWAAEVNTQLLIQCNGNEWVDIWFHNDYFTSHSASNFSDGIHFNAVGQRKYFKSVRGAIICTLKKM